MTVEQLQGILENYPPNAAVRFVQYSPERGMDYYHLAHACNVERQAKLNQVWFVRGQWIKNPPA